MLIGIGNALQVSVLYCIALNIMVTPDIITTKEAATLMRIRYADSHEFKNLLDIYVNSILKSERKSASQLRNDLCKDTYRFFVLTVLGRVIGFSIVFAPEPGEFALLEYMAIARNYRDRGYGAELLKKTANAVGSTYLILEVDSVTTDDDGEGFEARRIAFYRRQGCKLIENLKYLLPLETSSAPPEMCLLVLPAAGSAPISKGTLTSWISLIYVNVYGMSAEDPRIKTMVSALEDPVRIK